MSTPGGSHVGTQTFEETPNKRNKAWQYTISPGALSAEAAKRRKDNTQSIRDARKKANKEDETGKPTRRSLHDRAGDSDRSGGLLVGNSYGLQGEFEFSEDPPGIRFFDAEIEELAAKTSLPCLKD